MSLYSWGGGVASNVPPVYFDDMPTDEETKAIKAHLDSLSTANLPSFIGTAKTERNLFEDWYDIGNLPVTQPPESDNAQT